MWQKILHNLSDILDVKLVRGIVNRVEVALGKIIHNLWEKN